jgi:transposase
VIARGAKGPFPIRVRDAIGDNQALSAIIEPLLAAWLAIRDQITFLDRQVVLKAKADAVSCRCRAKQQHNAHYQPVTIR